MANRVNFYLEQLLTEGELDGAFDGIESAIWNLALDSGFQGITSGLVVSESAPPALTVDVTLGTAYDEGGRRVRVSADQPDFDCSTDEDGLPTTVVGVGNERWISIFAKFDRVLSDPRIDGASQQVYFIRDEGFELVVRQGAEAVAPATKPALDADLVLLADVKLIQGQTSILNADLDLSRRQDFVIYDASELAFDKSGLSIIVASNDVQGAIEELDTFASTEAAKLITHYTGSGLKHGAEDVEITAGDELTGTDARTQLEEIDARLFGLRSFLDEMFKAALLSGGAASDGGGLSLDVAAAEYVSAGQGYNVAAQSIALDDDDVSFVYFSGANLASSLSSSLPTAAVPLAKVTTVGGAITEIVDLRMILDDAHRRIEIIVSTDSSGHFSTLSAAVRTLEEWRSIRPYVWFDVKVQGDITEDEADLPITFTSDRWRVRGAPYSRISFTGATVANHFFAFDAVEDIVVEDLELRGPFVGASAAAHNRCAFYLSDSSRITLRKITLPEYAGGVHGFALFDPDTDCDLITFEEIVAGDCRDFGIRAASPSPTAGGLGVILRSSIRRCRFVQSSAGFAYQGKSGIVIEEGDDVAIESCHVEGFTSNSIAIGGGEAARRVRVKDCRLIPPSNGDGVFLTANAQQCWIDGCDIDPDGAAADGVVCQGSYNFIRANHISATANYGVNVTGEFNVISDNQSRGTGNNIVANNTAANNADDA